MSTSKIKMDNSDLSSCLQLEASTEFEYEELIFRWKLKLPLIKDSLLYEFESPIFIGGKSGQHSWKLRWTTLTREEFRYEMGIDGVQRSRSFVSSRYDVHLVLVAIGNTDNDKTCSEDEWIQAHAVISFKDLQNKDLAEITRSTPDVVLEYVEADRTLKMASIKESEFWDETNGYVVDNAITIFCRIIISCGAKHSVVSNSALKRNLVSLLTISE